MIYLSYYYILLGVTYFVDELRTCIYPFIFLVFLQDDVYNTHSTFLGVTLNKFSIYLIFIREAKKNKFLFRILYLGFILELGFQKNDNFDQQISQNCQGYV